MRQTILISTIVLTSILCFGQDHLKSAKNFNQYSGVLREYFENVFPTLYEGYSEKPIARYTSIPSFSVEYSFSLEKIEDKNYVMSNSLSESYWFAKNREEIKLISNKTELTNELYFKIVDMFRLLEEQTKVAQEVEMGEDGITYYFATTDRTGQVKIGETWSPDDKSLLARLVKICDNIYSLGNGENISQTETLKYINELLNDLKQ